MNLLVIVVAAGVCFLLAYRFYGALLARLLRLSDERVTPAVAMRDDVDYAPIERKFLLSQHFSAIAAAGPIVGPILAGVAFGWLPALLWIVLGSIFVGGVHDITALVVSIRHKAMSIGEVVRQHMSGRSYILFLLFIWIALVYIIVAFTDIVANSFVGRQTLEDGTLITGGATAASSLLYLALPVIMGLLLRYTKLTLGWATLIFLPLVGVAIWAGPHMPIDLAAMLNISDAAAVKVWDVLLLAYCLVAGAVPVWLLLQPRGHLGGFFLFFALAGAMLGIVIGGIAQWFTGQGIGTVTYPQFTAWEVEKVGPLFPMLFILIACGACSGFHCMIASGTTSKQLRKETDAKMIGYGAMLMEGMVAVVSLGCVMLLTTEAVKGKTPNLIYALGNAEFLSVLGIPKSFAISFALLAFTTFVYDTLDVCTRLGRYILQELTGMHNRAGRWLGAIITAVVPLAFVMQTTVIAGKTKPAWQVFWPLFGASNQLMAALALLGVTVWLHRTYRKPWVWLVTGLPTVFMYIMSTWALVLFVQQGFFAAKATGVMWVIKIGIWFQLTIPIPTDPVTWAALVLVGLAAMVLIDGVLILLKRQPPSSDEGLPAPAAV